MLSRLQVKKGITTFGFTGGSGGKMKELCNTIIIPSTKTEKIQEVHIMLGHIICYLIEMKFYRN